MGNKPQEAPGTRAARAAGGARCDQRGLVDGLHARPAERRAQLPAVQRARRLQPRRTGDRRRPVAAIGAGDPVAGADHRMARQAKGDPLRQRPRVHQWCAAGLGGATWHPDRAHPAGQAAAECLRRTLQPHRALRLACPDAVRLNRAGAGQSHPLAMDLQP